MKMHLAKRKTNPPEFVSPLTSCNIEIQRCSVSRQDASHRILIMRTGAHGDILMGTPLLAALRAAWPKAYITWIVERTDREAIDANPNIDEVLLWDGAYWKNMLRYGLYFLWLFRAWQFRRQLRRRQFDIFISFQPEEWPLLLRGVGAPRTVGIFDTFRRFHRSVRTSPHFSRYTFAYAHPDLPAHRIDQYLLTLDALGLSRSVPRKMRIGFTEQDKNAVRQFLQKNGCSEHDRPLVIAPLTTWPSKCWSSERYAELGMLLAKRRDCRIVLIGSRREREAIISIGAQMDTAPILAAGDLTFRQMAALLAQADLLVSGDTGPMHVAAAVGTPFVALFGSTGAPWYGPLEGRGETLFHLVPCGPCDQKVCPNAGNSHMLCMNLISVEEVLHAAERLLPTVQAVG